MKTGIELGMRQTLTVKRQVEFGIYLGTDGSEDAVLLPKKQVPEGCSTGDELEVFIYRDSEDRLIATTRTPRMELGEVAVLEVREVNQIGAFFDWGLEKDLLVPYKEQVGEPAVGKSYPVALYVDKSSRLCGTMKVYEFLREDSPYQKDDMVCGTIYDVHEDIGVFVAVDNRYHGVIPKNEVFGTFHPGDPVEARVTKVREDGKLNLSVRRKAFEQMDEDSERILKVMDKYKGVLPFTDKGASPELLKKEFHMSKNAFKRAIGMLLKENRIKITADTIERLD